jgi:hypothetical protein
MLKEHRCIYIYRLLLFVFTLLLFAVNFSYSDTIFFKDGSRLDLQDVWRDGDQVKMKMFGEIVSYPDSQVDRIIKDDSNIKVEKDSHEKTNTYFSPIKELPPNYEGDDIKKVFKDLYFDVDIKKGKGEFETTDSYMARMEKLNNLPIAKKTYIFKAAVPSYYRHFDADKQIFELNILEQLLCECKHGKYLGANAFGVEAVVETSKCERFWLYISNKVAVMNLLGIPYKKQYDYSFSKSEIRINKKDFKVTLELGGAEAKRNKDDLYFLYVCRPITAVEHNCFTWTYNPTPTPKPRQGYFTEKTFSEEEATIDDPYELSAHNNVISVTLIELIVYNNKTGQILKRFGPF